ncbi:MAG: hypothetical protein IKS76_02245 [Paludibacteraceae bacterium]|nr:hypothetical protein [Paludibacteraceae bacterium]
MTAVQTQASNQFLTAMGPMIEDKKAMQQVLFYISTMRRKAELPTMTIEEANQHGMPLHQAMDKLREKARVFYQA